MEMHVKRDAETIVKLSEFMVQWRTDVRTMLADGQDVTAKTIYNALDHKTQLADFALKTAKPSADSVAEEVVRAMLRQQEFMCSGMLKANY